MENNKADMIEKERQSFEIVLRGEVHDIVNGIKYPEIAIQKILHQFDAGRTVGIDENEKLKKELRELKDKCEADHCSIDELLSEFNRRGINTDNWDGDNFAEAAIVSGVKTHIEELTEQGIERERELEEFLKFIVNSPNSSMVIYEKAKQLLNNKQ